MLCSHNPNLESKNFVDGVDFTKNDPCIFVVYPAGAAGDLLTSIIDKHFLRTGCEYYGITDTGRVMIYTTDYELIDIELTKNKTVNFNQQWFYNFSDKLSERNLNYSLLDQVIFGCHLHTTENITYILDTFTKAKVINIYPKDVTGNTIIANMRNIKLNFLSESSNEVKIKENKLVNHKRVLNIPFGCLFNKDSYFNYYNRILNFLNLPDQLISFEYIQFYLSKQDVNIKNMLIDYSNNL
jgi:hypothetical protein